LKEAKDRKSKLEFEIDAITRLSQEPSDIEIVQQDAIQQLLTLIRSKIPSLPILKPKSIKRDLKFKFKFGTKGSGDDQFNGPYGVAVDDDNNIIVADYNNHCVKVFNSNKQLTLKFGSKGTEDGQFQYPTGVTVYNGNIVVVDQSNHRIQFFDRSGRFF